MEASGTRGKEDTSCTQGGGSSKQAEPTPKTPVASEEDAEAGGGDELDVCSDSFDPLLALYSPSVSLPYPNMKCFNNVAEYESFLRGGRGRAKPQNVEKKQRKAMKGVADPERIERLRKLMVQNPTTSEEGESSGAPQRRRHKKTKNVLTRMLSGKSGADFHDFVLMVCKGSPLGELQRCVEEKIRVKVHIRTFKGLRGICSGFVVAFDKFWNLAMVDVDETYREPLLGQAFYHEKALTVSRLFEKLKLQENPEEGSEQARKHTGKGKTSVPQPETPRQTQERDAKSRDPMLSRSTARVKDNEPGPTVKAQAPETSQKVQKKSGHPYGKVHTRHINQLFVRGENVLLVNPQPL